MATNKMLVTNESNLDPRDIEEIIARKTKKKLFFMTEEIKSKLLEQPKYGGI